VHAANGSGMEIDHIGHSVPKARKSLVSVNRLARDNNVFLEFHPNHFSIKEQQTKRTLLNGRCEGGLYPLKSSNKQVLGVVKPSSSLWHSRLGHASTQVVQQVISHHKLQFLRESNNRVCDACQQGKIHQLPYALSSSVSSSPLDLVFFYVWGPAPTSVGRHAYYVSYIDDYSKFSWIYLLRQKFEVFQCFCDFQNLVERQFNQKIHAIQTDWGGEYQALNPFIKCIGIKH
jgi:histone deacetylase 1/2